eukprot:4828423-Karenia_brevis.AAC.1
MAGAQPLLGMSKRLGNKSLARNLEDETAGEKTGHENKAEDEMTVARQSLRCMEKRLRLRPWVKRMGKRQKLRMRSR